MSTVVLVRKPKGQGDGMMKEAQLEQSLERVCEQYRKRQEYRDSWLGDGDKLRLLEARLCADLLPLIAAGHSSGRAAGWRPAETFVDACVHLLTFNKNTADQVLEYLLDIRTRAVVMDALCLCSEQAPRLPLVFWYGKYPELQAPLLRLWACAGMAVNDGLLAMALRDRDLPEVQVAALEYLATRGRAGALDCRKLYGQTDWLKQWHPTVAAAACRSGQLCGDGQAVDAALMAAEQVVEGHRFKFMRVLALSDHPAAVAILSGYSRRDPLEAARLLAIHGGRQAILSLPDLLGRCDPGESDAIAYIATGDSVPRRPDARAEGQVDAVVLKKRLINQLDKDMATHWLVGEPLSDHLLNWVTRQTAGQAGQLLAERLALHAGNACLVTPRDWMTRRDKRLAKAVVKRRYLRSPAAVKLAAMS